MKTTIESLVELGREINLDDFYCITLYEGDIKLQGKFSSGKVLSFRQHNFKDKGVDQGGYVEMERDGINITLTE